MHKKIVLIASIFLFNISLSFSNDFNIFSRYYITGSDFNTGESVFHINYSSDFKSTNKINFCLLKTNDKYGITNNKFTFKDGLLVKMEDDFIDISVKEYIYDSKSNLQEIIPNFTYTYLSSDCRIIHSGKFCERQTKYINDDRKAILIEDEKEPNSNEYRKRDLYEYYYNESNQIILVVDTSYNFDGTVDMIITTEFFYEGNKLVKKTESYDNLLTVEVRYIMIVNYDKDNNISTVTVNNQSSPEESYITYYSEYDTFGNWKKSRKYSGEVLIEMVERTIIYN